MNAIETVCGALQNPEVVAFERATLIAGYTPHFPSDTALVEKLVDTALDRLVASQRVGVNPQALVNATTGVIRDVYHKAEPDFWFNRGYHRYKTQIKSQSNAEQLIPLISGSRVLDYGCGGGSLSLQLDQAGFQVFTTDVLDYRYPEAQHLPFTQMKSSTEIPYPADSIDTTIMQAVLHHIDESDLNQILPQLAKVTKHLLIKEDSYGLSAALPALPEKLAEQPLLAHFVALPLETQFQILVLIDYFANAVAQGLPQMHMPFEFRTPTEWQQILASHGFEVQQTLVAGFEPGRMHQSCHIWLVCERTN